MAINFPSTTGQATDGSFTHTASGITWAWDGTSWKAQGVTGTYVLPTASATALGGIKVGSGLTINSTTSVLSTSAIALDDLSDVSTSGVNSGEILKYNGTSWAPAADDSGASALTIKDEGVDKTTTASSIDFVGAGVTATNSGTDVTVTIPGGGGSAAPEITWTLTASGADHYQFAGPGLTGTVDDPTLYLIRGQTYKFVNNTSGTSHPFAIQDTPGTSGTAYNTGVTNNGGTNGVTIEFEVPLDAPNILYYQCTAHENMQGEIHILSQGGGSRRSVAGTTASLATDAAANLDIAAIGSKSYVLHAIQTSGSAWVTVYTDTQSRTNDANRQITTDPVAGGGVIAECVTVGGTMQILTPAPNGFNADGIYGNNPSSNIYVKVVNRHTSAAAVTVTLKYLPLEY